MVGPGSSRDGIWVWCSGLSWGCAAPVPGRRPGSTSPGRDHHTPGLDGIPPILPGPDQTVIVGPYQVDRTSGRACGAIQNEACTPGLRFECPGKPKVWVLVEDLDCIVVRVHRHRSELSRCANWRTHHCTYGLGRRHRTNLQPCRGQLHGRSWIGAPGDESVDMCAAIPFRSGLSPGRFAAHRGWLRPGWSRRSCGRSAQRGCGRSSRSGPTGWRSPDS